MKDILKFVILCFALFSVFLNGESSIVFGMDREVDSNHPPSPGIHQAREEENSEARLIPQTSTQASTQVSKMRGIPFDVLLEVMEFLGKEDRYGRGAESLWKVSTFFCDLVEAAPLYIHLKYRDREQVTLIPRGLQIHLVVEGPRTSNNAYRRIEEAHMHNIRNSIERAVCDFVGLSINGTVYEALEDCLRGKRRYYEVVLGALLNNTEDEVALPDKLTGLRRLRLPGLCLTDKKSQENVPEEFIICAAGQFLCAQKGKFSNGVEISFSLHTILPDNSLYRFSKRDVSEMIDCAATRLRVFPPRGWVESSLAFAEQVTFGKPGEVRIAKRSREYKANFYVFATKVFPNRVKALYDHMVYNNIVKFMRPKDQQKIKAFYYDLYQDMLRASGEKPSDVRCGELSEFLNFLKGEVFDFPMNRVQLPYGHTPNDLLLDFRQYLRTWYSTDKVVLNEVKACLSNLLGRIGNPQDDSFSTIQYIAQEVDSLLGMLDEKEGKASTSGARL